jgi:asparagine synthase (glutamine-hydrolysing)
LLICGVLDKTSDGTLQPEFIRRMLAGGRPADEGAVMVDGPVTLGSLDATSGTKAPLGHRQRYSGQLQAVNGPHGTIYAVWQGAIFNRHELLRSLGIDAEAAPASSDAEILLKLYAAYGPVGVKEINGQFAFGLYDTARQEIVLGRDHFGIETLYYYDDPRAFVFSSRIAPILAHPSVQKRLNVDALRRFLVFNYNPAWDTFFRGIRKLPPGHLLVFGRHGVSEERYWRLSFRSAQGKSVADYCHDLRALMTDAVRLRVQPSEALGIFLSGGLDSSSVAALTRDVSPRPFCTFSYRCFGRSFDESGYARLMAEKCGSEHHELVYRPADVCQMEGIVQLMDEPFCNAGINIATFLLGQAAQGKVSRVFSGDGGDELFGGHPVYAADKMAAVFERLPLVLRRPAMTLLRRLPDSDQKLNLTVKLQRFAESLGYPRALGTYRWRIYYGLDELRKLLQRDIAGLENGSEAVFADVLELTHEADGPDLLSRSLYVDFMTEVGFYLRRMDLIRHFHITPCFPLLDHRLAEYAAAIPSRLKFRGLSHPKYIQHRAAEGVLPDEILHRKDKLGHSIPFKNWLRYEPVVKHFVQGVLSERRLKERGIVNSEYVQTLWQDHQEGRRNNSHRLWALTVLELWLAAKGF